MKKLVLLSVLLFSFSVQAAPLPDDVTLKMWSTTELETDTGTPTNWVALPDITEEDPESPGTAKYEGVFTTRDRVYLRFQCVSPEGAESDFVVLPVDPKPWAPRAVLEEVSPDSFIIRIEVGEPQ